MKISTTMQSWAERPISKSWTARLTRPPFLILCVIASLFLSLLPLHSVHASGVFWLPTQQASDASFDHLNPVLAPQ
jgi:hypothetical protein